MEAAGCAKRIRSCALDLLAMVGEAVAEGEEDGEGWELMERDLRLKATFLFCDFARLIAAAPLHRKQPLTDLANRLFQYIHESLIADAVQNRSITLTEDGLSDTAIVLQDVIVLLPTMSSL